MRLNWPGIIQLTLIGAFGLLFIWWVFISPSKWDKFKIAHHCKITAYMDGDIIPAITTNGMGVGATSDKAGWLCDNGITYWK